MGFIKDLELVFFLGRVLAVSVLAVLYLFLPADLERLFDLDLSRYAL